MISRCGYLLVLCTMMKLLPTCTCFPNVFGLRIVSSVLPPKSKIGACLLKGVPSGPVVRYVADLALVLVVF